MKTKPRIFLLSLTFLFLFSASVYGDEPIKTYWKNGNLMNETHYKDEKLEGKETWWWANGKNSSETHGRKTKRTDWIKSGIKMDGRNTSSIIKMMF